MTRKNWLGVKLLVLTLILVSVAGLAFQFTVFNRIASNILGNTETSTFTDVDRIEVKLLSVSIQIVESNVLEVTVKDNVSSRGLGDDHPIIISDKDGVLSIKQRKSRPFLSLITGEVVVEVPKGSMLKYNINNISGSIDHDAASGDTLTATSISGSVNIHHGGEKAYLKSTSGSVRVYEAFEELSASSVSGSVQVRADEISNSLTASSVSGSVGIMLERVAGYSMNYSTTSGSVTDKYENEKYPKSGNMTTGDGSLNIHASTVSGSIRLGDW